jgi:hypothetical protein
MKEKEMMNSSIYTRARTHGLAALFRHSGRPAALALFAFGLLVLSGCTSSSSPKLQVGAIAFTDANGNAQTALTSLSANGGSYLDVTLTNDSALRGADWSVSCGSELAPGTPLPTGETEDTSCGSFTPAHTQSGPVPSYAASGSGYVTYYTAPAAPVKGGIVTITAVSTSDPSRYSSVTLVITGLSISIGFAPLPPSSLELAGTAQLKAVLVNDYNSAGATWSVACEASASACGAFSPMLTESGVATTYTAPAIVPTGGTVIVTATSVADPTKFVSATITILPISVSVSPATLSVATNGTGSLSAAVTNDGENKGVDWIVSCTNSVTPGNCGTVSPSHTASGASTTYTAPSLANIAVGNAIAITATSTTDPTKSATATITTVKGQFVSGQAQAAWQPVNDAQVSLHAVTTSATALNAEVNADNASVVTSATTDEDGNFTIPYGYRCPTADTQMYLVSTGGNAGSGTNDNLVLMAALGPCSNLDASRVVVNEATTVSAVYAFSAFTTDSLHIGSESASPAGVAEAYATAKDLVDVTTGLARSRTVSGAGVIPQAKINSLANIVASCAATAGSSPGDGSACDQLLAAINLGTTPALQTGNTLQAVIALAQSARTTNHLDDDLLYRLATSSSSFRPALAAQPTDWTLPVSFSSAPAGVVPDSETVSVDSAGNVWIRSSESGATELVGAASSVTDPKTLISLAAALKESQP